MTSCSISCSQRNTGNHRLSMGPCVLALVRARRGKDLGSLKAKTSALSTGGGACALRSSIERHGIRVRWKGFSDQKSSDTF